LLGRFAKWQLPQAFVAVANIPRTAVGKIARRQLREAYADWPNRAAETARPSVLERARLI